MRDTVIVTGSAGLIGSETARFFAGRGFDIVGIDNNMRRYFFGESASTAWNRNRLASDLETYRHLSIDIRDKAKLEPVFQDLAPTIRLMVHTAAQPSHDWAANEPITDFTVNALGTLNLLELARAHCPDAPFIFTSTNKVYGDTPNQLPLVELEARWEIESDHPYFEGGIDETMTVDQSTHSLFGASKLAADMLVQEYGRYFGMRTACFRGGCLTGPAHSGTQLHGFLAYLMKCAATGMPYTVFGYEGKQVRDNIHSHDLVNAFWHFFQAPRSGEVYNIGGGRTSNCSMLEAIAMCEDITNRRLNWHYEPTNRIGDHIWWISDNSKFEQHYPGWKVQSGVAEILEDILAANSDRWRQAS